MANKLKQFPIPKREPDVIYNGNGKINIWFEEKLFQIDEQEYTVSDIFLGSLFRSERFSFDDAIDRFKSSEDGAAFADLKRAIINYEIERQIFDE